MKFQIAIDCDNDAFQEPGAEVARILEKLAKNVRDGLEPGGGPLHDANGNRVGRWGYGGGTGRTMGPGEE